MVRGLRGGGGSYKAACPYKLLPNVRGRPCWRQTRAVSLVPSPVSPTQMQRRPGNQRPTRAKRSRARCAGGLCRVPWAGAPSGSRYKATHPGSAQGLMAKGNLTSPDHTTHVCPHRYAVSLWGERTPARWRPVPKTWGPGRSATVSSPATHTGPIGTIAVSRTVSHLRARSQADQRRGENPR